MRDMKDIYWLAGLLEGEGTFVQRSNRGGHVCLQLLMSDKDVVIRAAKILGASKVIEAKGRVTNLQCESPKPMYRVALGAHQSLQWMMTIYSLMGERRQQKIRELIERWKSYPHKYRRSKNKRSFIRPGTVIAWQREHLEVCRG